MILITYYLHLVVVLFRLLIILNVYFIIDKCNIDFIRKNRNKNIKNVVLMYIL